MKSVEKISIKNIFIVLLIILAIIVLFYMVRILKKSEYIDLTIYEKDVASINFYYCGSENVITIQKKEEIRDFLKYLNKLRVVRERRIIYQNIRTPLYCDICNEKGQTIYHLSFEREYVVLFIGADESNAIDYALKYHIPFCKSPIEQYLESKQYQ